MFGRRGLLLYHYFGSQRFHAKGFSLCFLFLRVEFALSFYRLQDLAKIRRRNAFCECLRNGVINEWLLFVGLPDAVSLIDRRSLAAD